MADTLDVLTIAEARLAIGRPSSDSTQDAKLAPIVTGVSRAMDGLCGPIVKRTVTNERHGGGGRRIFLNKWPVYAITTVTEYAGGAATVLTAESETVSGSSNYLVDASGGLVRRSGWYDYPFGAQSVVVTYDAGRYADTASVDEAFKEPARIAVAHVFRSEQGFASLADDIGSFGPSFSLPKRALDLLEAAGALRPPVIA